jgi:hypothetical protein
MEVIKMRLFPMPGMYLELAHFRRARIKLMFD